MSEASPTRRSFRLKDKPAREYAYRNYLKVAIQASNQPKEQPVQKDWLPPAVIETNKKYDDIFSSVVTNAFMMDIQMTPDEYFAEKRAQMPSTPPPPIVKPIIRRGPRGPYKKKPKNTPEQLETRLTKIQNQIKKVTNSSRIKKRTEVKPIQKMEKITKSLVKIVEKIESDSGSDIEVLPTPANVYPCSCGKKYDQHEDCHRHLFEEHTDSDEQADCMQCGHRLDEVRTKHVCHICNKFDVNLEEHLKIHYQNCTGKDSVMECRLCTRQFKTVKEVVAHENDKHLAPQNKRRPMLFQCKECMEVFNFEEVLLAHIAIHIDINTLADKIEELQSKVDAKHNECPFCRCTRSSRKGFRFHLLKHHWISCKSIIQMDLSGLRTDQQVREEIDELTRKAEEQEEREERMKKTVKQEVKEEIHDDGYPAC